MTEYETPRRERRYRLQIPITLYLGKNSQELISEDISYSGLFLRTDVPPPVRGLVRFDVSIDDQNPLSLTGMVVHVVEPGNSARVPGVGVQLYGVGGANLRVWTNYVKRLHESHPESEQKPVRVAQLLGSSEYIHRRDRRFTAMLEVRVKTVDELTTMWTQNISRGGMFLTTDLELKTGDFLFIEIVHPQTAEVFGLTCVVRRATRDGVGVEFDTLDEVQQAALEEFIEPLVELEDDDMVTIA